MNKQDSVFCNSDYQNVIEVAGQFALFDFIFSSGLDDSMSLLKILHKTLYKYSSYPEYSGVYRTSNNVVSHSKLETCDYRWIYGCIFNIEEEIIEMVKNIDSFSINSFIARATKIHHKLTVVHPFDDGNGRVSRAMLNWLLHLKGLYPIYISIDRKQNYLTALESADSHADTDLLINFIIDEIIESDILLNSFIHSD